MKIGMIGTALFSPLIHFISWYLQLLDSGGLFRTMLCLFTGLVLGWVLYVPLHELLHAFGCLLSGGEVWRLEIKPLYGGQLLARVFPFVVSESQYAGRLSGFDTMGSDFTYAVTVFAPFVLTLFSFIGLSLAVRKKSPFCFALLIPCAMAPIMSLSGDFFELGSLLLYQFWPGPEAVHRTLISDDLFRLLDQVFLSKELAGLAFVAAAFFLGAGLVWATLMLAEGLRWGSERLWLQKP